MKAFAALVGILILAMVCTAEIIPINLNSDGDEAKCIQDTISSNKDTIRVTIDKDVMLDYAGIYVILTAVSGATDSFFCTGNPSPGAKLQVSRWDSTSGKFKNLGSTFFTADTNKVNFGTVATGSLAVPITFRDSLGVSSYPLNWYDGRKHYPFVLASEVGSDKEAWKPPISSMWDFVVWVGTGSDRAILTFCLAYKFDR